MSPVNALLWVCVIALGLACLALFILVLGAIKYALEDAKRDGGRS